MAHAWLGAGKKGRLRILVLCGNDAVPVTAANVYAEMLGEHEVRFFEENVLSLGRILRFSLRRVKARGIFSLLGSYLFYLRKFIRGEKKIPKQYQPERTVSSFSDDPAVLAFIEDFQPDLIIIGFCGLLNRDFLRKVKRPLVNTHPGINPRYRGFGNIWACYEGNSACTGFTIHEVDAGIDTGAAISMAAVDFTGVPFDEIDHHAAKLAARCLSRLIQGEEEPEVPDAFANLPSACYGVPTLAAYYTARRNYEHHALDLVAPEEGGGEPDKG